MQRATYVIAASPQLVEGTPLARVNSGVRHTLSPAHASPELAPEERARQKLETFLGEEGWKSGVAILVLPTEEVTYRRLEFPFRETRKIRQALPFELENELIEQPEAYASDFEIQAQPDGSAQVPVFLVRQAYVQGLVDTLAQHGVVVQKTTFAAQVLRDAEPAPDGRHFQIYVGVDEVFVTYLVDGRLQTVETLPARLGLAYRELEGQEDNTIGELFSALLQGEKAAEQGSAEEIALVVEAAEEASAADMAGAAEAAEPAQAEGPALAEAAAVDRAAVAEEAAPVQAEGPASRLGRVMAELERSRDEINRFLRIRSMGEPFTVSLFGLFAPAFQWHPGDAGLQLRADAETQVPIGQRPAYGILSELHHNPHSLLNPKGINFSRSVGAWLGQVRELRWPLALALVLLLVWLGLLGGGFYSKTGNQQHRLETLNGQLKAMLSLNDPENVAAVTRAVARLQDQVEKLKKEHRTLARFANYHYDTLDLFKQIADAMKTYPNLTVDSVSFNGDRFVMTGTTPNYTDSEGLKTALADLPRFKGRTTKITHTRAAQVIQYRLSIER